jgi:hypothetical protein
MNDYAQHIITKLKQQPRHGVDVGGDANDEARRVKARDQQTSDWKTTAASIERVSSVYKELINANKDLQDTQTATFIGINKLIGVQQDLSKKVLENVKAVNMLAQRNADLQKTLGLSTTAAADLGYDFDKLAVKLNTSRKNVEKNYHAIRKLTGGLATNSSTLQTLNQYYTVNRQLSQDAADGLIAFTANQAKMIEVTKKVDGKDVKVMQLREESLDTQAGLMRQQFQQIEKYTGIKGAQLDIENAIGKASSATRLTFSKYPGQLGMAVMKAKALGLELSDLETVGDNLLSIESSVGEELNYQLLTGHRLVDNQGKSLTNKYRELYLTGKSEEAAQTLYDIVDKEGDTLQNNMLARKQMAKTLGIEEDQLAKIVEKRKLIKNLTDDKGNSITVDLFGKTGEDLRKSLEAANVSQDKISEILKTDDTRSPEARAADALESMESKGILLQVGNKDSFLKNLEKANEQTESYLAKYNETIQTSLSTYFKQTATELGKFQIERQQWSQDQDDFGNVLLESEKARGGTDAAIADFVKGLTTSIGGVFKTALTGIKIADMTVTNLNTATATGDDTVMINDGIRFNPRDKFRRVNDGMTVAGTNVGGLDRYAAQLEKRDRAFEQNMTRLMSKMATTIKDAIQQARLQVNVDRSFGGSSLNPRGKYGAM